MTEYEKLLDDLKHALPVLSKTLKRAASFMLDHPGDIATLSMRQVATNADVSLPNFARLATTLGYNTYGEMRDIYRKRVQQNDIKDYHLRAETLLESGERESAENIKTHFQEAAQANVKKVHEANSTAQIEDIATALKARRKIYVTGMQASRSAATYLNYIGGMTSSQFQLIGRSGSILADDVIDLDENDALIAIAIRPCARATIEIATIARERGCIVVGITDGPASPLALQADHVLQVPTESPLFFESYIATIAIIETLIGFFTIGQNSTVVKRIQDIEADRLRLNEYWNDKE